MVTRVAEKDSKWIVETDTGAELHGPYDTEAEAQEAIDAPLRAIGDQNGM